MDRITIEKLEVFAHHGVLEEEHTNGQTFFVSADLFFDTASAAATDDLAQSVDYSEICFLIKQLMEEHTFKLIEAAAHFLAGQLLLSHPLIQKIKLRIYKPEAPIGLPFETVFTETEKSWHKVYIGIGSNLGDREATIRTALKMLNSLDDIQILKQSEFIITKPYGYTQQGDFINGCILIRTIKTPKELLNALNKIEADLGVDRSKKIHWGPRTIDLDVLLYDQLVFNDESLTIPHKDMKNREFVLKPLAEIGGYERHPVLNKTIEELWQELEEKQRPVNETDCEGNKA